MKKSLLLFFFGAFLASNIFSQKVVHLYEGKAPGSEDWNYREIEYVTPPSSEEKIRNVVDPTLKVYLPEKSIATGTAVIVCPGGGNYYLEYEKEGTAVAEWLVKKGVIAFVLKYRLNKTPESKEDFDKFVQNFNKQITARFKAGADSKPSASSVTGNKYFGGEDGLKAVEFVREHANEFGINPNKVGIMGFSAGAGVTMYVILNSASEKQPNFAAPIYGRWLRDSKVQDNAPPLFIVCAADDPIASNSPDLYKAWRAAGKSAELHIYSKGGHGFGMSQMGLPVNSWIERFSDWMKVSGF